MIGFEATYEGLRRSGYIFGWPLWANWMFFLLWAWVLLIMMRWTWKISYVRLGGRGILPDIVASAIASSSLFLTHPWLGHVHDQSFMIVFCGILIVYSIAATYYYRKIVLGINDWDRLSDRE